jgi:hypothetical protein
MLVNSPKSLEACRR